MSEPSKLQQVFNHSAFAIIVPAILGLGGAALSVVGFESYGWSLFLILPVFVSFLTAFFYAYHREVAFGKSYGMACWSIVLLGALILAFAIDGFICLLMALPLSLMLALLGNWLGLKLANTISAKGAGTVSLLLCLIYPGLVAFDHQVSPEAKVRQVTTQVVIDAPIEEVWRTVVAFPKIEQQPSGIFRFGIAYPIEARIEGAPGVGAIRYCTFSTGSFVEPITVWDEPNLLAFDVTDSPPPMKELSLYQGLHPPHLDHHLVSQKGQFRLFQDGDKVVLEGTTWYTNSISPAWYWGVISDHIIHKIHMVVLQHIEVNAQQAG